MQSSFNNQIIRRMTPADFDAIRTRLEPVEMRSREMIIRANYPVTHVYFPENGQISVLAKAPHSETIAVAMIGWEGMSDLVHAGRTAVSAICQIEGLAHRIDRQTVLDLSRSSLDFAELLMRYQNALLMQMSFTALAHANFSVSQRLARWLLMLGDRLDADVVSMPQEFLAWMLAVRRAGVTEALKSLREGGAIDTRRGRTIIMDRKALLAFAGGSYGAAEAEYERIMGPMLPPVKTG